MPHITIELEDPIRGETEYEVEFRMTAPPSPPYFDPLTGGDPGWCAEFEITHITRRVNKTIAHRIRAGSKKFDTVVATAISDYYDQLLDAARTWQED